MPCTGEMGALAEYTLTAAGVHFHALRSGIAMTVGEIYLSVRFISFASDAKTTVLIILRPSRVVLTEKRVKAAKSAQSPGDLQVQQNDLRPCTTMARPVHFSRREAGGVQRPSMPTEIFQPRKILQEDSMVPLRHH